MEVGGRVTRESKLPGLSAWGRVKDYREYQISQRNNVQTYLDSKLGANDILEFGFEHVALATGSTWRRDGVARFHIEPIDIDSTVTLYTPDDLMAGNIPSGNVVIYDDDHYYMGGVLAELLVNKGANVTLVTPAAYVSEWSNNTLEQAEIHKRLANMGVDIVLNRAVSSIDLGSVATQCTFTASKLPIACDAVVLVTAREPVDNVWHELQARQGEWSDHGIKTIKVFGDAEAPGPIAWATYAGHRYARELDAPDMGDALPFRREITALQA